MGTSFKNGPTRPHGLVEIKRVFGDIERFVETGADGKARLISAFERRYITSVRLPFSIPLVGNPARKVVRLRCHRLLAPRFESIFENLADPRLRPHVKSFGGCFAFRRKRSGRGWSTHAWGIAIDLNPETNPGGAQGDMPPEIVEIFREFGFAWGGDWKGARRDPMHFQYCTGY